MGDVESLPALAHTDVAPESFSQLHAGQEYIDLDMLYSVLERQVPHNNWWQKIIAFFFWDSAPGQVQNIWNGIGNARGRLRRVLEDIARANEKAESGNGLPSSAARILDELKALRQQYDRLVLYLRRLPK